MNIYVGNLPWSINDNQLRDLFAAYGEVSSANVIMDKFSGRSKGFGFVEMANNDEADAAIKALNEKEVEGRNLRVNEAKPREDRPNRKPRH
ncbi:MAG: RNA-binding protein [Candidatus Thiodiazotropha sp. (ex Monitilora ramsayi)]|nr:RNA-binding protein [Candidatus Thiodiazotropha sp. (ex Monitilora ramsayi)]